MITLSFFYFYSTSKGLQDHVLFHRYLPLTFLSTCETTNRIGSLERSNSFKDVVLSLSPRMVFGMYYNMHLIPDCERSEVFQAFWQHMLHEVLIPSNFQYLIEGDKENREIRVTIIVRNTRYTRILKLKKLLRSLQNKNIVVRTVDLNHGSLSRNSWK